MDRNKEDMQQRTMDCETLTLFVAGSKIYVKWRGGAFSATTIFSYKMAFFGSKNDKTIPPYIFEDLTEYLEPMTTPQPPKKPTF